MEEVRVEPDFAIAAQISFNSKTKTISYIGGKIESVNIGKILKIKITLVNGAGKNLYSQCVLIFALEDPLVSAATSEDPPVSAATSEDPPASAATSEDPPVSAVDGLVDEDKKAIDNPKNQNEKADSAKENKYAFEARLETSTTEQLHNLRLK